MSRQKKFVIIKDSENNCTIRFGYPFYHNDLISKDELNKYWIRGGFWELDYENKTITLYGSSADFGRPNKKDVENGIKNLNDDDYFELKWLIERIFNEEFPNRDYSDLKNYKFITTYD